MWQSPVDIRTDQVAAYRGARLLLRYETAAIAVENTGHVVEVAIPDDVHDTLQIGGDRYRWCSTTSTPHPSTPSTAGGRRWRPTLST
jgi:carbonic anhydrase